MSVESSEMEPLPCKVGIFVIIIDGETESREEKYCSGGHCP